MMLNWTQGKIYIQNTFKKFRNASRLKLYNLIYRHKIISIVYFGRSVATAVKLTRSLLQRSESGCHKNIDKYWNSVYSLKEVIRNFLRENVVFKFSSIYCVIRFVTRLTHMYDTKALKQYMKIYCQLCPRLPTENNSEFDIKNYPYICIYSLIFW